MADQETAEPDVLVVGSGPVGAAYVRLLTEARPDLDVLVVEAARWSPTRLE